jgi:hypothetical protein
MTTTKTKFKNLKINTSLITEGGNFEANAEDTLVVRKTNTNVNGFKNKAALNKKNLTLANINNDVKHLSPTSKTGTNKDINIHKKFNSGKIVLIILVLSPHNISMSKLTNLTSYKNHPETNKNRESFYAKSRNDDKSIFPAIVSPKPVKLNISTMRSPTNSTMTSEQNSIIDINGNNLLSGPNGNNIEIINVNSIINNQNIPISLNNLKVHHRDYDYSKSSSRSIGIIKSYAANTYQGLVRNYNEDRVSIILNIAKPAGFQGTWPKSSFFGIYDGHGGSKCADFMRDNLHNYIIKDEDFPVKPEEALRRGFDIAEKEFINTIALSKFGDLMDNSGSCAVVCLLIDDMCYVANLGDSRSVVSYKGGKNVHAVTNDHKPNEDVENKRIIDNGGRIYQ